MQQIRIDKQFEGFRLSVDLELSQRVTGLFGPSGSGKTSVLNAVAGLLRPDSGRIAVNGETLYDDTTDRDVPARRRRIGYVFQDALLFEHMSVQRNLTYARPRAEDRQFAQVVEVLELESLLSRHAGTLSGGEKRRVALGRALLSGPRLLLLDEPLTGLDRRLAGKTLAYIRSVLDAFRVPAIYVSHFVSDIIYLCDDVALLDGGRVTAQGRPRELLAEMEMLERGARPALKNFFSADVVARDPDSDTIRCRVGDQELTILAELPDAVRSITVLLPARDIILARARPERVSARNVLDGKVTRITRVRGHSVVSVDVGVELMVEVTNQAVSELALAPGTGVYVVVKASSIHCLHDAAGGHAAG